MALSAGKKKALASVMGGINKKFGVGTVSIASDILEELRIKFFKTPSHEFNLMMGGGLGKGKIIEFFGENSSGKTSMAMETIAFNQKKDPEFVAGWFETEGSFDPDYAQGTFGIDMDRCVYWDQSDTGAEKGLDVLRGLVASGEFDIICVNSVAGLTPQKEIEDDIEKQNIALQARMMSKLMRVICGIADKNGTTLIFINQMRTNVGQMFGDPSTTTGGKALAFYASQRVKMSKNKLQSTDPINEDQGVKVVCRTAKNRMAKGNPFKTCHYYAIYNEGIDSISELPDILEREGILRKSGSWYYWEDDKGKVITFAGTECKFRSRTVLVNALKDNTELKVKLEELLEEALGKGTAKGISMTAEEIAMAEKINKEVETFTDEEEIKEEA